MPREEVKLPYIYVVVDPDGDCRILHKEPGHEEAVALADGDAQFLRFLAFSDEAKSIAGKPGRVERMEAMEKDPEEDDEEDAPVQYEVSWEELR